MDSLLIFWVLILFSLIIMGFLELRGHAETARKFAVRYCQDNQLQLVSVSRKLAKLEWRKDKGPIWHSVFAVEFSSNGENAYIGSVYMQNRKVAKVEFPPYAFES